MFRKFTFPPPHTPARIHVSAPDSHLTDQLLHNLPQLPVLLRQFPLICCLHFAYFTGYVSEYIFGFNGGLLQIFRDV